jgi:glycosyltransferase involved in cell wall biosynthesis
MKIVHLTSEKGWRGGENQVCLLANGLLPLEQIVVAPPEAKIFGRLPPEVGQYALPMKNDLDLWAAWRLKNFCVDIDMVHAHTARAHAIALLAKYLGATFRLVVHRRVASKGVRSWWSSKKYTSEYIDRWIAISQAVKAGLTESGVSSDRIEVIHSAAVVVPLRDRIEARKEIQAQWAVPESHAILACVAHLSSEKGIDTLISAFKKLAPNLPLSCLIIGDGPERALYEAQSAELNDKIHFCGFVRSPRDLLVGCDFICLPSRWEGLGTSLLEGILAGCVPIGANVGGINEIIANDHIGRLFENVDELSTVILELVDSPEIWPRMVEAAQKHVLENFSVEQLVNRTKEVYFEVLKA